jgi:hypothetical protein
MDMNHFPKHKVIYKTWFHLCKVFFTITILYTLYKYYAISQNKEPVIKGRSADDP